MSSIVPMDRIRAHIRQDETYDDALLATYLAAAIRITEEYLGQPLSRTRMQGVVKPDSRGRFTIKHKVEGDVTVLDGYGAHVGGVVRIGSSRYRLPMDFCGVRGFSLVPGQQEYQVEYDTGPHEDDGLDPIVELGVLKLIAYMYENRGDEANTSGQIGVNELIRSSGALELFNMTRSTVFG